MHFSRRWRTLALPLILLVACTAAVAADRGVMVREANIYIAPDTSAAKLLTLDRGRELVVLERSGKDWIHVIATVEGQGEGLARQPNKDITGWMLDKGVVTAQTPNGDKIMYGEAVDSENEASRRRGRKGAAGDAKRLYYRMAEYFPQSPLAGEAAYRAADIQWQLDKEDMATRPSAKERDPRSRPEINEEFMRQVMKKYKGTKWADLAAFDILDNKLCGEWQAQSKCPEKEADVYLKYADEHPQSPKTPEALYNAAYRVAALVSIYKTEEQQKKSEEAGPRAKQIAQRVITQFPNNTDWVARAERLVYYIDNGIPVFGGNVD